MKYQQSEDPQAQCYHSSSLPKITLIHRKTWFERFLDILKKCIGMRIS